ncbi:MAG: adenosine-specific kinase [Candidatus Fermentibacteraceae bacterium]|nr:adenosine-specific kinase [Candidatus Fermentibacteraceae bacterium]MBN2607993.1 adenosine-specific kinase [Candidatus Fermentibacteraceae bacterium]
MDEPVIDIVDLDFPEGCNIIFGQSHFIKTVEDLYEAVAGTVPGAEFGLAFSEASGPRLVRSDGTVAELRAVAERNLLRLGCGHTFMIVLSGVFPIQVLNQVKAVPEVCRIYCASANPVQVIVGRTDQGGGVMGVIDGEPPLAVEIEEDIENRVELLKRIGYKR